MSKFFYSSLLSLCVFLASSADSYAQSKMSYMDSVSYAMGVNIAEAWKKQGITQLSADVFTQAIKDHLANQELKIPKEVGDELFKKYVDLIRQKQGDLVKLEGKSYLEKNKVKPGVTTTASGLQYEVLTKGPEGPKPLPTDKVKVHYTGTLLDGTVFDTSLKRGQPVSFGLHQVIKGWTEGLQLMRVGDKFKFTIPSELAYGDRAQGAFISPGSTLIFEVELLGINQ
jgi:FKBP-type peptidyl-prolyl cis-trans isomerase FklB